MRFRHDNQHLQADAVSSLMMDEDFRIPKYQESTITGSRRGAYLAEGAVLLSSDVFGMPRRILSSAARVSCHFPSRRGRAPSLLLHAEEEKDDVRKTQAA